MEDVLIQEVWKSLLKRRWPKLLESDLSFKRLVLTHFSEIIYLMSTEKDFLINVAFSVVRAVMPQRRVKCGRGFIAL